ncbi:MAG: tryptophan synthase subunit alpha [Alphaproteobacteria bacterium]|nr:tryptophan synthase subunit alpha [Alphaproteobacteria bacterium]
MKRINNVFTKTKAEKRPALIPFIMGGDGDTKGMLAALAENGADIIEIGIPFSDPMADGPVIQAAGLRALKSGASLAKILAMVVEFRKTNTTTPIILMGYYNPIYRYGPEAFCADAAKAGVDGVIVVDLPPEEEAELTPHLAKHGIDFIRLIAPTSVGDRLKKLCASASGFIYYIAVAGITGGKSASKEELQTRLSEIRTHTKLPIAVGFGIKTPEQASALKDIADAVVVGSALVEKAQDGVAAATQFIREISVAMRT